MKSAQRTPVPEFQPCRDPVPQVPLNRLSSGDLLIDVRTAEEFAEDHLPDAVNVPLLDEHERSEVGVLYRKQGVDAATSWALQRLRTRLHKFLDQLDAHIDLEAAVVIYCSRGGDRSLHVVQFLIQHGYQAFQLQDGYRGFRGQVRGELEKIVLPGLFLLDGLTGTGKTRLLRAIADVRPGSVIDLEGFAQHRSSLLGDVGLNPVSQKRFESSLCQHFKNHFPSDSWCLIEAESRKVGNREIPLAIWTQMKAAERIRLVANIDVRCEILESDYKTDGGWGPLIDRLHSLQQHSDFSVVEMEEICTRLNQGESASVARSLLEKHYDPRYRHQMQNHSYLATFEVNEPEELAQQVIEFLDRQISDQDS